MALTVNGFAPPTPASRGQGRDRGRRDNGVPPSPPGRPSAPVAPAHTGCVRAHRPQAGPPRSMARLRLPFLGRLWASAWLPSILLAGCLVALMYLLQTSGIATTGYDIQRLQAERDDWQLRNEQLQLELAKRHSLTWIESEATGRLGMVRARANGVVVCEISR